MSRSRDAAVQIQSGRDCSIFICANNIILNNMYNSSKITIQYFFTVHNSSSKSGFADEILGLSLFFKAFRASYSELICIFPCFCPYGYFTRESFCKMYLIIVCHFIHEPSGSPFCFPCGMGIYIHCGTHVRVS